MLVLFIKLLNKDKPKFIAYLPLIFILLESLCDNTMKCYNITYFIFAFMILGHPVIGALTITTVIGLYIVIYGAISVAESFYLPKE